MFESIVAGIISVLANLVYIDLKRKGKPGFGRMVLFWMGTPLTWLWFFIIKEGSAPALEEVPDDAAAILAEIRRDRQLRPGSDSSDPGPSSTDGSPPFGGSR